MTAQTQDRIIGEGYGSIDSHVNDVLMGRLREVRSPEYDIIGTKYCEGKTASRAADLITKIAVPAAAAYAGLESGLSDEALALSAGVLCGPIYWIAKKTGWAAGKVAGFFTGFVPRDSKTYHLNPSRELTKAELGEFEQKLKEEGYQSVKIKPTAKTVGYVQGPGEKMLVTEIHGKKQDKYLKPL